MEELFSHQEPAAHQSDSWKLFRIMSEFVQGFETFTAKGPFVSIFGGTRYKHHNPQYDIAYEVSLKIAKNGFSIITGAGPGLMEAANKAARDAGQPSAGLIPDLPYELAPNQYLDPNLSPRFRYFFVRKVMFVRYAQGFVFLPGGYGTLDEFFEIVTLVQTKKIQPIPIILMGSEFWNGLLDWLKSGPLHEHCVNKEELHLFTICDDPDKVANHLLEHYHAKIKLHGSEESI